MWSWNNGSSTKYQYFKDTSSKGHTGRASFGYNYISAPSSTSNSDQYDKSKYMPHMRGSTWYHKGMSSTNHQDPSSSYTAPNFELASNLTNATDNI